MNKIRTIADIDRKNLRNYAGCMITRSGILFNLIDPDSDDINMTDIAHHLSLINRWNGATRHGYSVAEHSINMMVRVAIDTDDPNQILAALFHDAEEAYWGDIISPIKYILKDVAPGIIDRMRFLRGMILNKYNIPSFEVSRYDELELQWEYDHLILNDGHKPMRASEAAKVWLAYAQALITKRDERRSNTVRTKSNDA